MQRTTTKYDFIQQIFNIIKQNLDDDSKRNKPLMPGEVCYFLEFRDGDELKESIYIDTVTESKTTWFEDVGIDEFENKELVFKTGGCLVLEFDPTRELLNEQITAEVFFDSVSSRVDPRSRLEDMFYLVRLLG